MNWSRRGLASRYPRQRQGGTGHPRRRQTSIIRSAPFLSRTFGIGPRGWWPVRLFSWRDGGRARRPAIALFIVLPLQRGTGVGRHDPSARCSAFSGFGFTHTPARSLASSPSSWAGVLLLCASGRGLSSAVGGFSNANPEPGPAIRQGRLPWTASRDKLK